MRLRGMQVEDLPDLVRLELAYIREVEQADISRWAGALDRNLSLWIACLPTSAAIVDGDGLLAGLALWQLEDQGATLVSIHVVPTARRKGVGRRLLQAFVSAAEISGAARARLGVHERNAGAERLYTATGFHLEGTDGPYRLFARDVGPAA